MKPVSSVPSAFNRAMPPRATPLTLAKAPTRSTLPSACCTATALTVLSAPGRLLRKVLSSVPPTLRRATRPRVAPPTLVNVPLTITFPTLALKKAFTFRSTATPLITVLTGSRASGVNAVSRVPSTLKRATRPRATPLTLVKRPPMTSWPAEFRATALTAASAPAPWLKVRSAVPALSRTRKS